MTTERAKGEIKAFLAEFPFDVDPKVHERLDADRARPPSRIAPPSLAYSADQELARLADCAWRMRPILDRRADEVRTHASSLRS